MMTLRVGIASYEEMKGRTFAVVRGERRVEVDEPQVWFISAESFAELLPAGNRDLLRHVADGMPSELIRAISARS